MRIIFLDFDGVITNIGERTPTAFTRTENAMVISGVNIDQIFNRLTVERLARTTITNQAKIVFSTSWRLHFSPIELCQMLRAIAPFPQQCFIGATPNLDTTRRGLEIAAWLKPHKSKHPHLRYAIVDDAPVSEFLPNQFGRLVQINSLNGFQFENSERVADVLQNSSCG